MAVGQGPTTPPKVFPHLPQVFPPTRHFLRPQLLLGSLPWACPNRAGSRAAARLPLPVRRFPQSRGTSDLANFVRRCLSETRRLLIWLLGDARPRLRAPRERAPQPGKLALGCPRPSLSPLHSGQYLKNHVSPPFPESGALRQDRHWMPPLPSC